MLLVPLTLSKLLLHPTPVPGPAGWSSCGKDPRPGIGPATAPSTSENLMSAGFRAQVQGWAEPQ